MQPLELAALKFWNAANFHRRAPDRDQTNARKVLIEAAACRFGPIRKRAIAILKEIAHDAEPASAD